MPARTRRNDEGPRITKTFSIGEKLLARAKKEANAKDEAFSRWVCSLIRAKLGKEAA